VDASGPLSIPAPEGHEREIALDIARRAAFAAPVAIAVAAVFAGWQGAIGGAIGMAVVAANFVMLAKLMSTGARAGHQAAGFAAMLSYVVLLIVVTLMAVVLRELSFVDLGSFVLTVAIGHIVLLAAEVPRVGLTLGAPGLKPRPLSKSERHDQKESRA
jgi:hypothetical protein